MGNGKRLTAALAVAIAGACGGLKPVALTGRESCGHCRMIVSDVHFAAEIVAPAEEPRFFDDIGCLAAAITAEALTPGAALFVADHRTGDWVPAASAVYTRVASLETPMSSHIVAHADADSRAADPLAAKGQPLTVRDVFGIAVRGVSDGR